MTGPTDAELADAIEADYLGDSTSAVRALFADRASGEGTAQPDPNERASGRCITCYQPVTDGMLCPCGCGRPVCPTHPQPQREPTATQLYNAVKAKRAELDSDNHILTIPEINAVLVARSEWASGEGTAPPRRKWPHRDDEELREKLATAQRQGFTALATEIETELAERGTAPQVPAEVLWEGETTQMIDGSAPYDPAKGHTYAPNRSMLHIYLDVDAQRVRVVAADGAPQPEADRG